MAVTSQPPRTSVSAGLLYALRIAVLAQAAALLVAASFAGQAVESDSMLEPHVMAGMVVHLVALVQIVLAVLLWRPGRGAGWPALASVALFVVGMAQHFTWESLGAHLPNGVILFGLVVAVLVWSWSPAAARRR
ncbi:hypothetical protein SAMN05444920_13649 [Nonomuraea solani]|uniref:Uncharacterized protein n=1 Tax=Nonomuraea solani TaxID=1144553 RepID=A0A1H6EZU1_9ACTN|nr:hypothetical protein [Nonomuraea solani]SEH03417.1 hypothetical protein SAMN05444920_13649 [Nonomuraea solani]